MLSILKLDFSHNFTLQNSILSWMSLRGTQQWLHNAFFQSSGVSAVRGLLTLPGKYRLPGKPSVSAAQVPYSAFPEVLEAKNVLFRQSGGTSQALHCHSHAPTSTGLSYPTTQVIGTATVQSYHPSTDGCTILWLFTPPAPATSKPTLFLVFFPSCFSCFAYWTALFAWQQLEKSIEFFSSKPAVLQLQNSCWEHSLSIGLLQILVCATFWSWNL